MEQVKQKCAKNYCSNLVIIEDFFVFRIYFVTTATNSGMIRQPQPRLKRMLAVSLCSIDIVLIFAFPQQTQKPDTHCGNLASYGEHLEHYQRRAKELPASSSSGRQASWSRK
ncbi:hypothetical protein DEU56DRAFT_756167 [Suillus clintonianus]|uniref:uncharacterized protein n=1 Tax=Suillus clintonianus TaxID=1904413 RepID=UPI001B86CCBB|nr:uncharacterized protein DEU56DRAFT_756167 [Suillus clintonianus]KAG2137039.1 hypothetical protein DEU56DRAFT_756167 [Suillus clintonianus]